MEKQSNHDKNREKSSPIKEAFTRNRKETIQGMIFASGYGAIFYISLVYLPTWLNEYAGVALEKAMQFNTLGTVLVMVMVLIPVMGWICQ